jgi:hypothetical protein
VSRFAIDDRPPFISSAMRVRRHDANVDEPHHYSGRVRAERRVSHPTPRFSEVGSADSGCAAGKCSAIRGPSFVPLVAARKHVEIPR